LRHSEVAQAPWSMVANRSKNPRLRAGEIIVSSGVVS
jgi:hypothetical protein